MTNDNTDLANRVEQLETRVAELEEQLNESSGTDDRRFDHYDEYVLEEVDDPAEAHPRTLMRKYDESGIVDRGTKKQRAKRLRKLCQGDG